jgi:hypothetical protein
MVMGCAPKAVTPRAMQLLPGDLTADEAQRRSAVAHFAEAQGLLAQERSGANVQAAFKALLISCREGHPPACDLINAHTTPGKAPTLGGTPRRTAAAYQARAGGWLAIACHQLPDGRIARCAAREDMGYGMVESVSGELQKLKGTPTTFFDQPVESEVIYAWDIPGSGTEVDQFEWARDQVVQHPDSATAWQHFARLFGRLNPNHPKRLEVLARAVELRPGDAQLLNELAWLHVEAGRYAEAYPLSVRLIREAPSHPSYLDTFAAAAVGVGHCEQGLAAQRRALAALATNRTAARSEYEQRLADYEQRCASSASAPAP